MLIFPHALVLFLFFASGCGKRNLEVDDELKSLTSPEDRRKPRPNNSVEVDPIQRLEEVVDREVRRIEDEINNDILTPQSLEWMLEKFSILRSQLKDDMVLIKQADVILYRRCEHLLPYNKVEPNRVVEEVRRNLSSVSPDLKKILDQARNTYIST